MPRNLASIPRATLDALNAGKVASRDLVESLAVDFPALLQSVCPHANPARLLAAQADKLGFLHRIRLGGAAIAPHDPASFANHTSDAVRAWSCFALLSPPHLSLPKRLKLVRPFAAGLHFAVREWAWLPFRPRIAPDLPFALSLLAPRALSPDPALRRFASEVTRPRGVRCAHLTELKKDPAHAFPLLEPLRADASKYVQDSVANWLNDASKTAPGKVRVLLARWLRESPHPATRRIATRALRTIGPKPQPKG